MAELAHRQAAPRPPEQGLQREVEAVVVALVAELSQRRPADIKPERRLHEAGFDSVQFVELSGLLNDHYGLDLDPTVFFKVHTPRAIAGYLLAHEGAAVAGLHAAAAEAAVAAEPAPAEDMPAADGRDDIAIVGMAGVLPQSADLEAFWRHLVAGDDLITETPAGRWDWRQVGGGTRWGGFMPGIDQFDAAFFGVSPREAEQMDPQQRLLLQSAWAALEDAAIRPGDLAGSATAVFVGASTSDYLSLLDEADGHLAIGNAHAMLANRLSFLLDTHGPSEAIDTACSSSLVALHRAVQALRRGESELAIVAGVNALLTPRLHQALDAAGMLSPDGRCKTFDAGADGYVRGEGVVALVLKPLSQARRDGNPVWAVVKGSAVNHGGHAAFLTAPDVNAQAALLNAAWRDAGVPAETVSYIEAHGTGTALGDPIEVQAIRQALGSEGPLRCGLGSVKSSIGHLESAAGLAGVAKVALAMRHRLLPASLHCRTQNPYLKLADTRYFVVDTAQPWPAQAAGLPLRAGVSSFGFGGTNAHVVLEACADAATTPREGEPGRRYLLVLSARDDAALLARADQLRQWLDHSSATDALLPALAATLARGREVMPSRLAFACGSLAELQAQLAAVAQYGLGSRRHGLREGEEALAQAAAAWLQDGRWSGASLDAVPLLRLPTYPFQPRRFWPTPAAAAQHATPARLLLDSTLPLVGEHRLAGEPVLPAAAQIIHASMAAAGRYGRQTGLALRQVRWLRPVVVGRSPVDLLYRWDTDSAAGGFSLVPADQPDQPVGRGEVVAEGAAVAAPLLDLAAIRSRCTREVPVAACYQAFGSLGIDYGPAFRTLRAVSAGDGELLARLQSAAGADELTRQAALLDGAFQSIIGLQAGTGGASPRLLPAGLERMTWFGALPEAAYAWVRETDATLPGSRRFDLDLLDETGRVCARVDGLLLDSRLPEADRGVDGSLPPGEHTLVPVWLPQPALAAGPARPATPLVVLGGTAAQWAALAEGGHPLRQVAVLDDLPADGEHLVWLPDAGECQDAGSALDGFRLVKRLLALGFEDRQLRLTVLTVRTWALPGEAPAFPRHAGLAGLLGSLAKEYPHWTVRLLDLPAADALPPDWDARPTDRWQRPQLWRHGQWFAQGLVPLQAAAPAVPAYRHQGVYIVVGGAGGVGRAWTEHVVRHHLAQVVWVGRRPLDADLQAQLDAVATLGAAPLYLRADATDRAALEAVREQVLARFGRIDGVVHSAIVLDDGTLAQQDEARFQAAYAAQAATALNLATVFGAGAGFLLFFSSMQSSFLAAGQGNYAAGCTFKDALAQWLRARSGGPVKVINWGYWGHTGVVASDAYRQRMRALGIGSIEPAQAMAALDTLLAGPADQLSCLRTLAPIALPGQEPGWSARTVEASAAMPATPPPLAEEATFDAAAWGEATARLERAIARRVYAHLVPALAPSGFDLESVMAAGGIQPKYRRWLGHTLASLAAHSLITWDGRTGQRLSTDITDAGPQWAAARDQAIAEGAMAAHARLADATLAALPAVLRGERPATDVVFPDGGMALVEALYQRNRQSDHCNRQLAQRVEQLLGAVPEGRRAALLEIGAGTGGTTVALLPVLANRRDRVAHYDFTDISKAFLLNAEQTFGRGCDALRYRLFNVEQDPAGQGLAVGGYDLVIATNVLHATRDIATTLRHAKALLKAGGCLLINELLQTLLFTHTTFGLLDGWWLHDDSGRRLPGSPLLSREGWSLALREAGFAVVEPFGGGRGRGGEEGQGVIVAVSDGLVLSAANPPAAMPTPAIAAPAVAVAAAPATGDLRERCVRWLRELVARTLKMPAHELLNDRPLGSYGVDSILVIGLTKAMRDHLAIGLSNATLFEHQTIDALADFLVREHPAACARVFPGMAPVPAATAMAAPAGAPLQVMPAVVAVPTGRRMDVAVIGLSGRYAQADNLQEFWENLRDGRHCITEVPADRWDWQAWFDERKGVPGRTYSRWGGFLKQVDGFDATFFKIPPREAQAIDPQSRLFLEEVWAAIEDAGYTAATLSPRRRVGVFAGVMNGYYPTGAQFWAVANRVSHLLDFTGPSLAVDTACSSSLTAIHLALESLASGSCDCAIAGGVNLVLSPRHFVGLSSLTMLSAGDQCRAFGDGADGFVDGEGVGAVVLKPLARAVADGDAIYGVIKGSMINAGGRTHGLTVPNPQAQQAVVQEALERSGVAARDVSYIEAHGTGTALGDPIELAGLTRAFRASTSEQGFCAIGSVKSNIGHCESAAGIAGVTKVLLQLQHGELVPTLHAETANPDLNFADSPFALQRQRQPWPSRPGVPRSAGVSSFGAGGANAHVVIQEFIDTRPPADDEGGPALIVLSGATREALRGRVEALLTVLGRGQVPAGRLQDLAWTLQLGREAMAWRLGCVVRQAEELAAALRSFLAGDGAVSCQTGQVDRTDGGIAEFENDAELRQTVIDRCIATGKFEKLLALWCRGLTVDWAALHAGRPRRRLHLPTYPFAREQYWYEEAAGLPRPLPAQVAPADPLPGPLPVPAVPPGTAVAEVVRRVVAEVLGYPELDLAEGFLALGGNSIRAAYVQRQLQDALGVAIPLSALFEARSLRDFAEGIESRMQVAGAAEVAATVEEARSAGVLSTHQQQFFFLDRLNPGNPAFNLPGALRVQGPFDPAAVAATYQALLAGHDVLRTRFVVRDGQPVAEVAGSLDAAIEQIDLAPLLPKRQAARLAECLEQAGRHRFDLEQGPLSRLTVLTLGDEDHILVLNLHHIVGDAASVGLLLATLAQAGLSGKPPAGLRPPQQYAAWAEAEQQRLPQVLARSLPYWLERLAELPRPINLPADRPRPAVPSYQGRSIPLALPAELVEKLNAYCKAANVSSFVVLLAAFKTLLKVLARQDDIVVGSPFVNRSTPGERAMVGCLAYALVLRSNLQGCASFEAVIGRVRETVYGAFDHQGVPYTRLVEALNPQRYGNANPLYQVMFNVIPMEGLPRGAALVEVDSGFSDYDLFARLYLGERAVQGALYYSEDLFDAGTAAEIAGFYLELLHTLLAYPALPIDALEPPPLLADLAAREHAGAGAVQPLRIVVASTFTDRPLAATLCYWGQVTGQAIEPVFSAYGQVFQTLYDPTTAFHGNTHGLNVLLVRPQDWQRFDAAAVPSPGRAGAYFEELADALREVAPELRVPVLVMVLPHVDGDDAGEAFAAFQAAVGELPRISVVHWRELAAIYPVAEVFDAHADAAGHIPFTGEYYAAVASYIARHAFQAAEMPIDGSWNRVAAEVHAEAEQWAAAESAEAGGQRKPYVAPRTDAEWRLTGILESALKQTGIGIDDSFFDLGGHSILAIQLVYQVNQAFGTRLSVADVFMAPTVRQLAERLESDGGGEEFVDLGRAAVLPDDIRPLPAAPAATPAVILLTGATGFVGRYLLCELLARTEATVHCLVRARDPEQGRERLRSVLQKWGLWNDADAARIVAVPGDLAAPRLGLGDADHAWLAAHVDAILHNGTSMNHLESFEMARTANVDGVADLLRLTVTGRPKTFNYLSTLAVFSPIGREGRHVFDEAAPIDGERHRSAQGYTTSKWAGEHLVHQAMARGVPCNVFRLGLVTGDTAQGRYDEPQSYYRLLKSCLQMGLAFDDFRYDLVITPVDYVARALTHLATRHAAGGKVFHLSSMDVTPMTEVFAMINRLVETPMRIVPHSVWLEELRTRYERGDVQPIVPVVQWMMALDEAGRAQVARDREAVTLVYDCTATHRELEAAGIPLPPFNPALLRRYLQGMLDHDTDLSHTGCLRILPPADSPTSTETANGPLLSHL